MPFCVLKHPACTRRVSPHKECIMAQCLDQRMKLQNRDPFVHHSDKITHQEDVFRYLTSHIVHMQVKLPGAIEIDTKTFHRILFRYICMSTEGEYEVNCFVFIEA